MDRLELGDRVREILQPFGDDESRFLEAMHAVQHEFGYIPKDAIPAIGRHYDRTPADIFGFISFYAEIFTEPPAENLIAWCSGPACRLKGGVKILEAMEATLGLSIHAEGPDDKVGEHAASMTADGRVGLHWAQCNGTCGHAPQVWVNGRVFGPLSTVTAIELARDLKEGKSVKWPLTTS
ncbi:MAG TPA: NAD(P)H-dependent oxidoreductase subunit E [Dehalococcoidia bacterium]|nr:NAD(P)H-dependent oxidoreductase subunit E [Dehalococcoidia bacterium]